MSSTLGRRASLGAVSLALAIPLALGTAFPASAAEAPAGARTVAELSAAEGAARTTKGAVADRPELNGYRLKTLGSMTVWIVIDGKRRGIPGDATYLNLFHSYDGVQQVIDLASITDGGPLSVGAILADAPSSDTIWLISNGQKRGITGRAWARYGFDGSKVRMLEDLVLNSIPQGPNIDL
ncbi:hypothetical protein OG875_15115 [Streptomyces sp. NBC_01498]|uniref:hypothetical protein n=1 Tax=Streptomyces sp. NBC_01498 TaxID=2975870 RepID=UPI002E7BC01A|nr:hypothetical protein [Streptomyces sp. NBC_01498]WTL25812.1 hypothetical protein OG875_15115 [Streptomyces sp. NBC_01498]